MAEQMMQEAAGKTIPAGYKQTEVGVIPEDWDVCSLGNCAYFIGSGKTNTKSYGGYPLYGSTGVIGSCEKPEYSGDALLVARVGANAGKLNFVSGEYGVSDNAILIKLNPEAKIQYFKYWLIRKNLNTLVFGSGQPLITGTQLKELLLPFPPVEEQTAIANVLSVSDALIDALEQLIAKKQGIKTATMQQLLTGRTRLPQFALRPDGTTKGYKTSELGQIPEDWDATTLGDISEVCMCKRIFSGQTVEVGEIPFYKIGTFGGEPDAYISVSLYKKFRDKYSFPEKGDILISAAGTLGKTVIYDGCSAYFQDSNIVWLKIDKSKICNEYLYHAYKLIRWASPEGSTISRLYNGIIRATMIAIPTLLEQTTIATILSDMDSELTTLEQKLAKARDVKQGMMQQLLTGRIRLPLPKEA